MALSQLTLATTANTVLISYGNTAVTTMYLCNYSASDVTVSVHLVQATEGIAPADDTNIIYKNVPIAANDTYIIDTERLVLANGDSVQALASADTSITMTVSHVGV